MARLLISHFSNQLPTENKPSSTSKPLSRHLFDAPQSLMIQSQQCHNFQCQNYSGYHNENQNHQNRMGRDQFSQISQANNFKEKIFPQPSTMTNEENQMILRILQKYEDLEEEVIKVKEENAEMKKEAIKLNEEVIKVTKEVMKLKEEAIKFKEEVMKGYAEMKEEVIQLKEENAEMKKSIFFINNKYKAREENNDEKELAIVEKIKWTYNKKNPKNSDREEGKNREKEDEEKGYREEGFFSCSEENPKKQTKKKGN